ncbi:MAG: hypothetical protein L0Y38_03040 [Methylococcaceae bacterium]|nr:hypothetical protein [Methylococcaceae bacterium]MCI0732783.1 hypothetical protein [Methylococcaceae bacterium]
MAREAFVHFMVALACEAMPLVEHYRLSRLMDERAFPIYRNDSITLTVTGIGKTAMAAGVAYTHVVFGKPKTASWLNVGVAGHPDFRLGEACLAHKITDRDCGGSWYPPLIARPPCPTESLITGSRPETAYLEQALYDMEASGFYATASRFSSSERVQCFKVVSDNRSSAVDSLQAEPVAALIGQRIGLIELLLGQQQKLVAAPEERQSERLERFIRSWRFSLQQTRQLESLLQRWMLLDPEHCPEPEQLGGFKNGRQVLIYLQELVERLPMVFP